MTEMEVEEMEVAESVEGVSSHCSANPQCAEHGLGGNCCPTNDIFGIKTCLMYDEVSPIICFNPQATTQIPLLCQKTYEKSRCNV